MAAAHGVTAMTPNRSEHVPKSPLANRVLPDKIPRRLGPIASHLISIHASGPVVGLFDTTSDLTTAAGKCGSSRVGRVPRRRAGAMVMDDDSASVVRALRRVSGLVAATAIALAGCTTYVGTTARSFLGHVRNNPDPNVRYLAYSKLASPDAYDSPEQKSEAAAILIDKLERGREPVATRAIICRTLGELREPKARDVLVKSVSSSEAVVKIEACRALGKVGRSEDATVLAQIMALDNLEDARIAAIEGLAELKTKDPRIFVVLLDGMEHEDPAIRLASLSALRSLTRKDYGTDASAWRRELKPTIEAATSSPASDHTASVPSTNPAPEAATARTQRLLHGP
jgi:hypothetical protein